MKKILILADGILAKYFLERVISSQDGENNYSVVYYRAETLPAAKPENFKFYEFDPTSEEKLSVILNDDYYQAMVLVSTKLDAIGTYKNIRKQNPQMQIVMVDRWGLEFDDTRLHLLDSREVLSSRFIDYLPDMPVIAQNVGLGKGEIMEIRVPVGSSYAYRHLGNIVQKNWRIAAIYRVNELLLPRDSFMIQPNDVLLGIGDPNVLKSVYHSVKVEKGRFPQPFGQVIYCLIDMLNMDEDEIELILNDAMLLHSKINSKKLFIKVVNPTFSKLFEKIKGYNSDNILVDIDYFETDGAKVLSKDANTVDLGLIVVKNSFFVKNKKRLFEIRKPIFKIGVWGFSDLKEAVVLSGDSEDVQKETSVVFDLSMQLDLKIKFYNFNPQNSKSQEELGEYFKNLSKIFNKDVDIISPTINPLIKLRNEKDILQFVPFSKKVEKSNIFSIFSTNMEQLYFKLSKSYQVFIPVTANE
ncbi:MAG: TrkA C-terminal domain-containing protein [Sulfurospirillum sp.]